MYESTDKKYEEVSYDSWYIDMEKQIDIGLSDFIKVRGILVSNQFWSPEITRTSHVDPSFISADKYFGFGSTLQLRIYLIPDEWYMVKFYTKRWHFYKCDQIDGLIQCIEWLCSSDKTYGII